DRADLRHPGDRPVLRHRRHGPGLLRRDGAHGPARDDRDRREHGRRHPLRDPRPAHAGGPVMASTPQEHGVGLAPLRARKERRYPTPPGGISTDAGAPGRASSLWRDAWYRYIRNRAAVIAGVAFLVLVAYCLIWPLVSPYDPYEV